MSYNVRHTSLTAEIVIFFFLHLGLDCCVKVTGCFLPPPCAMVRAIWGWQYVNFVGRRCVFWDWWTISQLGFSCVLPEIFTLHPETSCSRPWCCCAAWTDSRVCAIVGKLRVGKLNYDPVATKLLNGCLCSVFSGHLTLSLSFCAQCGWCADFSRAHICIICSLAGVNERIPDLLICGTWMRIWSGSNFSFSSVRAE